MQKIYFLIVMTILSVKGFSQAQYSIKAKSLLNFDSIARFSTTIKYQGKLTNYDDGNIQIIIYNFEEPETFFNIYLSNSSDTLLFNMKEKKVYIFSERKVKLFMPYYYNRGDAINYQNGGMDVVFSSKLKSGTMPFPVVVTPPRGIFSISNKTIEVSYLGETKNKIDKEFIKKEVETFEFVNEFLPGMF